MSLKPVPQWVRYDLAKEIEEKIKREKLEASISDFNADDIINSDLPPDILVEGAKDALLVLIPFIYDWLTRNRVICEKTIICGDVIIKISGNDPENVLKIAKRFEEEKNDSNTEYNYG